jgi:hypothetical protein
MNHPLDPPAVVRPAPDPRSALAAAFAAFQDLGRRRLDQALVIGQLLAEQKKLCGHGNWLARLKENAPFGRERAADFIRVHLERAKCGHLATFEEALQFLRQSDPTDRGDAWEPPDEADVTPRSEECRRPHDPEEAGAGRAEIPAKKRKKAVQPELEFDPRAAAEAEVRKQIDGCREHAETLDRALQGLLAGPLPGPARDELRRLGKALGVPLAVRDEHRTPVRAGGQVELVRVEWWPAAANLVKVLALLSEQPFPPRPEAP